MTERLRIKNWERYQHYKDRRPPWIKYHVELLDDYELMSLSIEAQLVYDRLLLVAATSNNSIPADESWISRRIHIDVGITSEALAELVTNGFLVLAGRKRGDSAPLSFARSREAEAETEKDKGSRSSSLVDLNHAAERAHAVEKLLDVLTDKDERTPAVVSALCRELSPAQIRKVAESAEAPGVRSRTRYAVGALKSESREVA